MKKQYIEPKEVIIDYALAYGCCGPGANTSVPVEDEREVLVREERGWDSFSEPSRNNVWEQW